MKKPAEHKTKRITIKEADVDELVIPVVKWLNSFLSITTLNSCHGKPDDEKDGPLGSSGRPYVHFLCRDLTDLATVLSVFDPAACRGSFEMCVMWYMGQLNYVGRWGSRKALASAIEQIDRWERYQRPMHKGK